MSITLIHEERITHSATGLLLEDDLYIKLDAHFDELVAELGRGGQLPALIHIMLREAHASSGRGSPATIKTIMLAASCEERQARRIVKSLLGKSLITDAGLSPRTGERFYRPLGYAWFGNKRTPVGVSPMTPLAQENAGRGVIDHPPVLAVAADIFSEKEEQELIQQQTKARAIFKKCGVQGKPLERLSVNVAPAVAKQWRTWLEDPPAHLKSPIGVMINALLVDPTTRPDLPKKKKEAPRKGGIIQMTPKLRAAMHEQYPDDPAYFPVETRR